MELRQVALLFLEKLGRLSTAAVGESQGKGVEEIVVIVKAAARWLGQRSHLKTEVGNSPFLSVTAAWALSRSCWTFGSGTPARKASSPASQSSRASVLNPLFSFWKAGSLDHLRNRLLLFCISVLAF